MYPTAWDQAHLFKKCISHLRLEMFQKTNHKKKLSVPCSDGISDLY